jgi:hypothetical protein
MSAARHSIGHSKASSRVAFWSRQCLSPSQSKTRGRCSCRIFPGRSHDGAAGQDHGLAQSRQVDCPSRDHTSVATSAPCPRDAERRASQTGQNRSEPDGEFQKVKAVARAWLLTIILLAGAAPMLLADGFRLPDERESEPSFPSARPLTGTANTMAAIQALM